MDRGRHGIKLLINATSVCSEVTSSESNRKAGTHRVTLRIKSASPSPSVKSNPGEEPLWRLSRRGAERHAHLVFPYDPRFSDDVTIVAYSLAQETHARSYFMVPRRVSYPKKSASFQVTFRARPAVDFAPRPDKIMVGRNSHQDTSRIANQRVRSRTPVSRRCTLTQRRLLGHLKHGRRAVTICRIARRLNCKFCSGAAAGSRDLSSL